MASNESLPTPPARGMSLRNAESDIVLQLKRTVDELRDVVRKQELQLQARSGDAMVVQPGGAGILIGSFETIVSILRKFLDSEQHSQTLSDPTFQSALESIENFLTDKISTQRATLAHLQKFIADTESAWQDHTTAANDDLDQLKQAAWSGYGVGYHYDFFVSYRVASDSALARELSLLLVDRGFKGGLDVGVQRMMMHSNHSVANVLLEWETAMCAQDMGFCLAVPIFIGTGAIDFTTFPRERAVIADNVEDSYTCKQSAFTALSQLNESINTFYLPDPDDGVPSTLIDNLVQELNAFDELHRNFAPHRAHVVSVFDAPQLWIEEEVTISNVSLKQVFFTLLTAGLAKKPTKLSIHRSWQDHELVKVRPVLSSAKSIEELFLQDCVLNSKVLDVCESMPFLKAISLNGCKFDENTVESDIERICSVLKSFKNLEEFWFWRCMNPLEDDDEDEGSDFEKALDRTAERILETLVELRIRKVDFSCRTITDELVKALKNGFAENKTITTLFLEDITTTARNLLSVFAAIKDHPMEDISIHGKITDTVGPNQLVQTLAFAFAVKLEDIDLKGELAYFTEPIFENRSIKKLRVSAFWPNPDRDEEIFFSNLFSCKSLKKFTVNHAFSVTSVPFIIKNLRGSSIEELFINASKFRQSDMLELLEEAKKCGQLKRLGLADYCCGQEVLEAAIKVMNVRKDLDIAVDWFDDVDAFARSAHVLPTFLKKCKMEEFTILKSKASGSVLALSDGNVNVQATHDSEDVTSIHKSILQKASQLETNDKLIQSFSKVKEAVEDIVPFFKKCHRHVTESNLPSWQWAIEHNDSSVIQHLKTLPDAEEFMRSEAVRILYKWKRALTPLGFATTHCKYEVIEYLMDRGAGPIACIPFGSPLLAFYRALGFNDSPKMAEVIRQKFGFKADEKFIERVSPSFERRGFTVLHKAALNGYYDSVKYILPLMENPGVADEFGSTALHCAARLVKMPEDIEINYEYIDHIRVIEILNESGEKGRTALDIARKTGNADAIAALKNQLRK
ncbi:hypothetical protein HDU97_001363 [Phlyctochytrium planicorne]|nr:hypothetical protein HDU97_001363 [Phlyctochytrium planicorne]